MGALTRRIPDRVVEEIKQRTNIVETISRFVELKRAGSNFRGLCPFHMEKTPSFMVSEEKQIFHCFGCGVGGNVFTFLIRFQGKTFPEVLRDLASQTGVQIPEDSVEAPRRTKSSDILKANKFAARYFYKVLSSEDGKEARDYLYNRGISDQVISNYKIGFAKDSWDAMGADLSAQGVPVEFLSAVGLVGKRKQSSGYYDRFRNRIMFPIIDARNNVVGFGGRAMAEKSDEPKYLNSPESEVFSKGSTLFGLPLARGDIRTSDEAIIVEGYFDQISLFQAGIKNVVATLGTAITENHLNLLKSMARRLIFLFDGDKAGIEAAGRAVKLALQFGVGCRVVLIPRGEDPDIHIRNNGIESLRKLIKSGQGALEFLVERILQGTERGAQDRMRVIDNVAPLIAEISDPVAQSLYAKELAQILGVPSELVDSAIGSRGNRKRLSQNSRLRYGAVEGAPKYQARTEWLILEQFLQYPDLCGHFSEDELMDLFEDGQYKQLLIWLLAHYTGRSEWNASSVVAAVDEETLQGRITATLLSAPVLKLEESKRVVWDCIRRFKLQQLLYLERDLMQKIQKYVRQGDVEQTVNTLKTYQDLIRSQKQQFESQGG